jgi:hypothetical protein
MSKFHRDLETDDQIMTWAQSILWIIASDDTKQSHDDFSIPIGRLENLLDHTVDLIMQKKARQICETGIAVTEISLDDLDTAVNSYTVANEHLDGMGKGEPKHIIMKAIEVADQGTGSGATWVQIRDALKEKSQQCSPPVISKWIKELKTGGHIVEAYVNENRTTKTMYILTQEGVQFLRA